MTRQLDAWPWREVRYPYQEGQLTLPQDKSASMLLASSDRSVPLGPDPSQYISIWHQTPDHTLSQLSN